MIKQGGKAKLQTIPGIKIVCGLSLNHLNFFPFLSAASSAWTEGKGN
jgi:hypothetical protein